MWTWHAKISTALSTYFHLCFIFGTPSFQFIVVSINVSKSFKSIFAHRHLYSRKTEDLLPSETMIPLWTMLFLRHQQCHTGCDQGVGATSALSNQLEPRATTEVLLFATIPPLQQLFTYLNSILEIYPKIENLVPPSRWQKLAAFRRTQKWSQNFRQARICFFRDKFIIIARNCKFANLIHYNLQYIPCNSAFLAQEVLNLSKKAFVLPKVFQKVRKSQQILTSWQTSVC